jgi:hypothetical protein
LVRFLVLSLVFSLALSAGAQNTSITQPPPPPFIEHLGLFVDSGSTNDFQQPTRTLRASRIKIAREHDRIFVKAGGSIFGAYTRSGLVESIDGPLSTGVHGERYVPFAMTVDPQRGGWQTIALDGHERLYDFDWDSRGYIYLAYSIWGFGIVDLDGALQSQTQPSGITPTTVMCARGQLLSDRLGPFRLRSLRCDRSDGANSRADAALQDASVRKEPVWECHCCHQVWERITAHPYAVGPHHW